MKKIYSFLLMALAITAVKAQAPTLVIDINDGTGNSSPSSLTVFDGKIFFSGDDISGVNTGGNDLGREPWVTDGTAANTNIIKDINPGDGNSAPFNVFQFMGELYFTGNDGAAELWKTDLTEAGTVKVDLFPSVSGDTPNNAVVLNNVLYFTTNRPATSENNQLAEWNGTDAAQIVPNSEETNELIVATELTAYNGLIYGYLETSIDEPAFGRELYSYNPGTDVFTLIKDIAAGNANSGISNFTPTGGLLYFEAEGNLWQTDGTEANTVEVPASATLAMNGVNNLYNFNDDILFEGDNGSGDQLWILDTASGVITQISTNAGTNANHDPSDYVTIGGAVYYRGEDSDDTDGHLFRTDGITTFQLDNSIKDVDDIVVLDGVLYFEGEDTVNSLGNELYKFDPATASITRVNVGQIKMFPNPSTNGVVEFAGIPTSDSKFTVTDLSGRQVLAGQLTNNQLSHNLKTGVYFVQLEQVDQSFKLIVD